MEEPIYLIGEGRTRNGERLRVGYARRPEGETYRDEIYVQIGTGPRTSDGYLRSPREMLEFRPYQLVVISRDPVVTRPQQEPPGWFERQCAQANCPWFVEFAKRMAAGERISAEELEQAHLKYNGKPVPHGEIGVLFE